MLKIRIAEDDRGLRQLFTHVLTRHGYYVTGVSNGQEVLDAMDKVADGDFSVRLEYRGSEPMMRHVWDNLIGNAVKFSPPGGAVRLRLEKKLTKTIFTVEDTGPGAAEKMRLQIERGSKMAKGYIIFNPLAGGGKCKEEVGLLEVVLPGPVEFF